MWTSLALDRWYSHAVSSSFASSSFSPSRLKSANPSGSVKNFFELFAERVGVEGSVRAARSARASSAEYTRPPTEHLTKAITFCVSVPVLSDKTHPTWPSSSLSAVVRTPHLTSLTGSYIDLSRPIQPHCITFTSSNVTYSEMGMSALSRTRKRTVCVRYSVAPAPSTSGHTPLGIRYQ